MKIFQSAFFAIVVGFTFVSCAGTGSLQDNRVIYNKDFNTMVEVVEQVLRSSSMNINYAEKSGNGENYTIVFSENVSVNNQSVQQQEGEVIIEKIDDNKTGVRIENPDYHFSVPDHQRKEYDRILTNRIKDLLDD
jgi:hypothetical protein